MRSLRRRWMLVLTTGILLVSLGLTACAPADTIEAPPEETTEALPEEAEPEVEETAPGEPSEELTRLVVGLDSEPNTFDPHKTIARHSESFMSNVFDGLTAHNQEGEVVPALATSWEALDDYTWEFKLREGVEFHNGDLFNADSVKFTLDRVVDPEFNSPLLPLLENITNVEIVDDYTVHIEIAEPDLMLPARLSVLYGHMLSPEYVQQHDEGYISLNPVGTGPFVFKEWVKDDHITLVANENYWGEVPGVDEIVFRPIKDTGARVAALLAGEVDIVNGVPTAMEPVVRNYPGVQAVTVPVPRIYYVTLDVRKPPFDDKLVRQALNYAVDRESIVDNLFAGFGRAVGGMHPQASWGFNPEIEPYPYDPDKARELLADAGYPDGFNTEFDTFVGRLPAHDTIAQAVIDQLSEVGVNVEVNAFEFGVFSERRVGDRHAPMLVYSIGDWALEPVWMYGWLTQGKAGHYWSPPEWEALLTELSKTYDPEARVPLYHEVQQMVYEECPFIPVVELETIWGIREGVLYEPRPDEALRFARIGVSQ